MALARKRQDRLTTGSGKVVVAAAQIEETECRQPRDLGEHPHA